MPTDTRRYNGPADMPGYSGRFQNTRRWAWFAIGAFMCGIDTGKMHGPERERSCFCPDDCNCHHPWRMNYCGCKGH